MRYLLTLVLLVMGWTMAQARESIAVIYGWSLGDSLANYHRALLNEANQIQNTYQFVLDARPGAGGSIAINHVLKTPNAMAAHTTAFFVRPNVYPKDSHDPSLMQAQFVMCRAPLAVSSTIYGNWQSLPRDRPVTVGVSGLGVTTHLIATQLQRTYPNLVIVPFRSTNDSMMSMVAGMTDLHIGFLSESEQWIRNPPPNRRTVYVLGITGRQSINQYRPLIHQGFDPVFAQIYLTNNILVPKTLDAARHREFYLIFKRAARAPSVLAAYAVDYCEPMHLAYDALPAFYDAQINLWRRLAADVKIENPR